MSGGICGAGKQLLGLCAGNYCASGGDGQQRGNGRLVEAALREGPNGTCAWVPQRVIRLPSAAYFAEFSSLAFRGNRTLISSRARRCWVSVFVEMCCRMRHSRSVLGLHCSAPSAEGRAQTCGPCAHIG